MISRTSILALALFSAVGCSEEHDDFLRHLRRAQEGDPYAQQTVAAMYAKGEGVWKNCSQTIHWLELSAAQELDTAQAMLGQALCSGYCSTDRQREGISWLAKAANQGNPYIQAETGIAYATGACGDETSDLVQAYTWLTLAGYDKALRARDSLAASMDEDQVATAEALISSWEPATGLNDEALQVRDRVLSGTDNSPRMPDLIAIDGDLDVLIETEGVGGK